MVKFQIFKTTFFEHILKKKQIHFMMHGHSSSFTPSEGPKGFVNSFLKKLDNETRL